MIISGELSVFINCPYDQTYQALFDAVIFAVLDCGFHARAALEFDDGNVPRVERICALLQASRFSIHDLSRVEVSTTTKLPRFNMPFELGLFVGMAYSERGASRQRRCMIMESADDRYRSTLSDIAGNDIYAHNNDPGCAIASVRAFLRNNSSSSRRIPGGKFIQKRYGEFQRALPSVLQALNLEPDELLFADRVNIMSEWLLAGATEQAGKSC